MEYKTKKKFLVNIEYNKHNSNDGTALLEVVAKNKYKC